MVIKVWLRRKCPAEQCQLCTICGRTNVRVVNFSWKPMFYGTNTMDSKEYTVLLMSRNIQNLTKSPSDHALFVKALSTISGSKWNSCDFTVFAQFSLCMIYSGINNTMFYVNNTCNTTSTS